MSRLGFVVLFSTLALFLVRASAAPATPGCDAPPDTAATEQYCETLPAPQGSRDVTQPSSRPLADTLPQPVSSELGQAGLLGDVLMALATGTVASPPDGRGPGNSNPARVAAAQRAEFDPRVDALAPGPGGNASSAIGVAASAGAARVQVGFGLVLVLILVFLAGCSIGSRNFARGSGE